MIIENNIDRQQTYYDMFNDTINNGGFTHSKSKGRYVVGTGNINTIPFAHFTFKNMCDSINQCSFVQSNEDLTQVGLWLQGFDDLEEENPQVYIDFIFTTDNLSDAIHIAKINEEIAIYDRKENKTINVCG